MNSSLEENSERKKVGFFFFIFFLTLWVSARSLLSVCNVMEDIMRMVLSYQLEGRRGFIKVFMFSFAEELRKMEFKLDTASTTYFPLFSIMQFALQSKTVEDMS